MKSDMATIHRNLSRLDPQLPSAADMKFGIVVSQWNPQITGALLEGAVRTLPRRVARSRISSSRKFPEHSNWRSELSISPSIPMWTA